MEFFHPFSLIALEMFSYFILAFRFDISTLLLLGKSSFVTYIFASVDQVFFATFSFQGSQINVDTNLTYEKDFRITRARKSDNANSRSRTSFETL